MAGSRNFAWAAVLLGVVGALVVLSFFALDQPNVVWSAARPHCPHCRADVPSFAHRCPTCREPFDWTPTTDETSPWCDACLAPLSAPWLAERRKALGDAEAEARAAVALHVTPVAARAYLASLAPGKCAWCGGTGRDPSVAATAKSECPLCIGRGACIGCDGRSRRRMGDEGAARALARYASLVERANSRYVTDATRRSELERETHDFLRHHAGTVEVDGLRVAIPGGEAERGSAAPTPAAAALRERIAALEAALR